MFGGDGGNAYFCGEKNEEAMLGFLEIVGFALSGLFITCCTIACISYLINYEEINDMKRAEKKKKDDERNKEARERYEKNKYLYESGLYDFPPEPKKEEDLRYLGACFMD